MRLCYEPIRKINEYLRIELAIRYSPQVSPRAGEIGDSPGFLEHALLAVQSAHRADVGDAEGKQHLVFVAGAEGKAAILRGDAAAIGVVPGLRGQVFQDAQIDIVKHAGAETQAALVLIPIGDLRAQLVGVGKQDRVGPHAGLRR